MAESFDSNSFLDREKRPYIMLLLLLVKILVEPLLAMVYVSLTSATYANVVYM